MPVRVVWSNDEPADREEWEDILRAEYGTAMGQIVFHIEKTPEGYRLACVEEEDFAGAHGERRLDQRQRFLTALVAAGKPVVDDTQAAEAPRENENAERDEALEPVGVDALNAETERARRDGGSGE
jgi:hypothetical protein